MADPHTIRGVQYGTIPGLKFPTFRCGARQATLTTAACAGMFASAQTAAGPDAYRLAPCRSCELGAGHSGVDVPFFGHLYDSMICPRCGFGTTRMIRGRLCVNCYNREREVLKGKNAKGTTPSLLRIGAATGLPTAPVVYTAPVVLKPGQKPKRRTIPQSLHRISVHYTVNGAPHSFQSMRAVGTWEVCAHVMRITAGTAAFQFRRTAWSRRDAIVLAGNTWPIQICEPSRTADRRSVLGRLAKSTVVTASWGTDDAVGFVI